MWQTKSASAVPKNLGLGLDFRLCSEGDFFTGCPYSVYIPKFHQGNSNCNRYFFYFTAKYFYPSFQTTCLILWFLLLDEVGRWSKNVHFLSTFIMAVWVVEFSNGVDKIRKIFA